MEPIPTQTQEPVSPTPATEPKKSAISLPAAILSSAAILAIAIVFTFGGSSKIAGAKLPAAATIPDDVTSVPADVATIRPTDHIRGDISKASVAIIEYSDSDCPYCARFHTTMQQVVSDYNGKVAWVYRYFPLISLHPNATTEAVALECVAELGGNTAFNNYLDTLITTTLAADPKSNEVLTTFATREGIDAKLFKSCMAGTKASDRVKADATEANKIGAQGTPFSIAVNLKTGKQIVIPGALPLEDIKADIDALLK